MFQSGKGTAALKRVTNFGKWVAIFTNMWVRAQKLVLALMLRLIVVAIPFTLLTFHGHLSFCIKLPYGLCFLGLHTWSCVGPEKNDTLLSAFFTSINMLPLHCVGDYFPHENNEARHAKLIISWFMFMWTKNKKYWSGMN